MYDVYPFVTTAYERRDEGYLALGSYMEGCNADAAKMNLTQPIMMRYEPATVSICRLLAITVGMRGLTGIAYRHM